MPIDKSISAYGSFYHRFLDPPLAETRQVTTDLITDGSSVIDIACGTGQLCFELRKSKHCHIVGIDLSLRMLEFARKSNPFKDDVSFWHEDATDLSTFRDGSFDFATMLMIMHELPRQQQIAVLKEALRVANKGVIIDSVSPLPKNGEGIGIRIVEATIGNNHYTHFKSFLANGGIHGLIKDSGLQVKVDYSSIFLKKCREVVIVSKQ
jgi:ubiquinone/menaquinone biosynthesis C-methylase UbiE